MSPKKYVFFCREVKEHGVKADPEKIQAIAEWLDPKNVTELRRFLGLCIYYRKFVIDLPITAKPLHRIIEEKQLYQ